MGDLTVEQRFTAKVQRAEGDDACWLWTAARLRRPRTGEPGYGVMKVGGRKGKLLFAHRIAWQLEKGTIPDGLCVLHRCDNPGCVRPDHLFLGTYADNNKDMGEKERWRNQYKDNPPTECKRGHPFDATNTRIDQHGNRVCRNCARDWMRARRASAQH